MEEKKSDAFGRRFFFVKLKWNAAGAVVMRTGSRNSIGGFRRPEHLPSGSENDPPVQAERPVFQIIHVESHAIDHVFRFPCLAAKALNLRKAGDAGLDETADPVGV